MNKTQIKEKTGQTIFTVAAIICVIAVAAIFVFMLIKSIPAFNKIGLFDFIFGETWAPDRLDNYETSNLSGSYGILKMIVGTLATTVGALLIGGTLGYFTAVFLAFYCPKKLKKIFSSMVNLLAGIPSVVYGFFGIVFLLPLLANFAPNDGSGLLATSLILGIMIMPTVVSLSKTSLEAVPRSYYEGALALGSTHSQAVFGTVTKAAKSGVTASLVLGIGRALGETMAVVMVAGNSVAYPESLFNSFRVLTANIVLEMGYAGEVQQGALVATGVILLVFVLIVNLVFGAISKKAIKGAVEGKSIFSKIFKKNEKTKKTTFWTKCKDKISGFKYKIKTPNIGAGAAICAGVFAGITLLLVIGFIFAKGTPQLFSNSHLLFGEYEFGSRFVFVRR